MPNRPRARRAVALACLLPALAAAPLGGCASSGGVPTPEERLEAFQVDHDAYARLGYRLDWQGFPAITQRGPIRFLEPYDDIVVAQEAGNTVSALETSTGRLLWSDQPAAPLTRFVGIARDGNRVYVCGEGELFVLDAATGNMVDRQSYEKIVSTEPVQYGRLLIFGTGVGEVLAHLLYSAADGVKLWGYGMSGAIEADPVLIGGSVVGAVSRAGDVAFLDAGTGTLLARNRIWAGPGSDPVADDEILYIASRDQSLYAFEARTGRLRWRHRTPAPLTAQPTLHDRALYITLPGQGLTAFDAAAGTPAWNNPDVTGTVVGLTGGDLLVWNGREAFRVDPQRGDVIERASLPGVSMLKLDRFDGGNLYVVSELGLVARFVPRAVGGRAAAGAPASR